MYAKKYIMIGLILGSIVGGYIPTLFGAGFLSMSSLLGNMLGGIAGIVLGYKASTIL